MSKLKKVGYELKDVAIIQAPVAFANHRSDVNPFVEICGRQVYPIFVSPMASVTDQNNYKVWIENKLTPLIPRSVQKSGQNPDGLSFADRIQLAKETFVSFSLKEAQEHLISYFQQIDHTIVYYVCIDIAHGTLSELYDVCKKLKETAGSCIQIMTGNVANPAAYSFYADAGIDWCRLSIGTGSRCTSSTNVGVHYPSATLLDDINEQRKAYAHSHNGNAPTKLILDGGVGWFDDIQKAIALGADAVMCGKIFAECEEACGSTYYTGVKDGVFDTTKYYSEWDARARYASECYEIKRCRDYFGMSTKRAQCITGGSGNVTSEGIDRPVEVKYPVAKWVDNMQSYLRSCMTYTNSHTIQEMQENAQLIILGGSGDSAYRK